MGEIPPGDPTCMVKQSLLRGLKSVGTVEIPLSKLSRRVKSGRILHEGRQARIAVMSLRYAQVDLPCGPMTAIQIREDEPNTDPLEWVLLTSLSVEGFEDAKQIVDYYLQRWRVEDFFRVLKGGCKIETFRMRSAQRLHRAIAIPSVIAWRLLLLTLLGRDVPNASVDLMFTEIQVRVLNNLASEHQLPSPKDLTSAIALIARLGGYQPSNHRPPPRRRGHVAWLWAFGNYGNLCGIGTQASGKITLNQILRPE